MRTGDGALREALQPLNDEEALLQRDLERTFLKATGGNCKLPVGAYASLTANQIVFYGFFGREEGSGSVQGKKLWDRNLREETPREQNRRLCQAVADFARELMDQVNAL